jgi:4-hydroxybenzoyl-CoA thioesterase
LSALQQSLEPPAGALVFRRDVRIEWGDCDPARIVFFPRYFAFFDANTAYLFEAAGLPKPVMIERYDIVGIPLVDVAAKFSVASKFGETITIESHMMSFGRSSMKIAHRVLKEGGMVAIEALETRVWAGHDPDRPHGIRAKPIPQEVIDLFKIPR